MASPSPIPSLPENKRYILTHTPTGTSTIHSSPAQHYHTRSGPNLPAISMSRSYSTSSTPADLTSDTDISSYLSLSGPTSHLGTNIVIPSASGTIPSGANLVVVDIAPGGASQMHRTVSIDFSICVIGKVCMELDSGEHITLNPGDHVIQRGTMHAWYNGSSTEPARFIAVTLPCVPFEIPGTGKMLSEEHLVGTEKAREEGSKL